MGQYRDLMEKQEIELADFPKFFAFNMDQLKEGLEKLGVAEGDKDAVTNFNSYGFVRKDDYPALLALFQQHEDELQQAIADDQTGEGFIFEMFRYELANHEFGYTWEVEDTLEALGFTHKDLDTQPNLAAGLKKAIQTFE